MNTTTKTNKVKNIDSLVFPYIMAAIDFSGHDLIKQPKTDAEKLQFVADCFHDEYCNAYNLKTYGSYQNVFANWLMGLPSVINIDFENYRIIEIAKEWGSIPQDANDKQEDKILDNWFNFIACKVFKLMRKNKVNPFPL